jgi:asparagine synthase (glutamine-hydrolysing)
MPAVAAAAARSGQPDAALVARMLAAAPHRGDNSRVQSVGRVALGVVGGADIAAADGLLVAFTGVLDNAADVADALAREGRPFDGGPPGALVAAACAVWSAPAVAPRLRGAYAVVATDGVRVWAFRDHLGAGGLFYGEVEGALVLGSEAKQVAAAAPRTEPDVAALETVFYGLVDDETPCVLAGVHRLPRATVLSAAPARIERYWHPERLIETARLDVDEAVEAFRGLLTQAVTRCLRGADAISLSGGIDSPTIAAVAGPEHRARFGRPLGAVSAVFPDHPRVDERPYIEAVSDAFGIELHTHVPTARPLDDLERWVRVLDAPVATLSIPEVNEHYTRAEALGYRTLLSGDVGEFLYDVRQHLAGHLLWHGRWGALARLLAAQHRDGHRWVNMLRPLLHAVVPARVLVGSYRLRRINFTDLPAWIDDRKVGGLGSREDLEVHPRERWIERQVQGFRGPILTGEADEIVAALHGLVVRRPLTDVDLWEFFVSLPAEVKFADGRPKSLVRRAMRGWLPDVILDRRTKTSFNDFALSTADYPALRRWLVAPRHRVDGIDYALLERRLDTQDMGIFELMWANDLAGVHAFLDRW